MYTGFLKVYNIAMKGNVHANKPKIIMLNIILSDALETMPRNSMYSPALWLYTLVMVYIEPSKNF